MKSLSRPGCTVWLAVSLAAWNMTGSVSSGSVSFFTDKASFDAVTTVEHILDFNNGVAIDLPDYQSRLGITFDPSTQFFNFVSPTINANPGFDGNTPVFRGLTLDVSLSVPADAFGLYVFDDASARAEDLLIQVFEGSDATAEITLPGSFPHRSLGFIGFTSDVGMNRVLLKKNGESFEIDNVHLSLVASSPEPDTAWLFALGQVCLILYCFCRKRCSAD